MNAFEQIALGWACLGATLRRMGRPVLWSPWLALGVAQLAALLLLAGFAYPLVSGFMAPLVTRLGGATVRHYPEVFRALPDLQARAGFAVDAVLGVVLAGAATVLFAAEFERRPADFRAALGAAFGRAWALLLASLPLTALVFAVTFGLEAWLTARGSAGITRRLTGMVGLGGSLLLRAAFLYLTPLVMLGGHGPLAALRELPRTFGRGGLTAFTLTVLTALLTAPFAMLSRFAPALVEGGVPEAVAALTAARIAGTLAGGFLLAGGAVLAWQSLEMDVDEGW